MMISEHLINSALREIERANQNGYDAHKCVMQSKNIQEHAKHVGISMDDVWYIAQYVYYCYKPYVEEKATRELIDRYGYELED